MQFRVQLPAVVGVQKGFELKREPKLIIVQMFTAPVKTLQAWLTKTCISILGTRS